MSKALYLATHALAFLLEDQCGVVISYNDELHLVYLDEDGIRFSKFTDTTNIKEYDIIYVTPEMLQ